MDMVIRVQILDEAVYIFTLHKYSWKKYGSNYFPSSYRWIIELTRFFKLSLATSREGKLILIHLKIDPLLPHGVEVG